MINEIALANKRDSQQEYTVHLFEFCNLSCSFCWQDHDDRVGVDTVLEKLIPIEKFLQTERNKKVVFKYKYNCFIKLQRNVRTIDGTFLIRVTIQITYMDYNYKIFI